MRSINRDCVAALIFSKDGKLFQGKKDPTNGGVYSNDFWHIPGGGIDKGETPEEAINREIKEETGIDVSKYEKKIIDDKGKGESEKVLKDSGEKVLCKMKFIIFKIEIKDKDSNEIEVHLNDDLVEFQWTNIEDLKRMKLTPPSVELFKRLEYL